MLNNDNTEKMREINHFHSIDEKLIEDYHLGNDDIYIELDSEFMLNDPYYDIPQEALNEEEIPEFLIDRISDEEYERFLDNECLILENILANDPYYEDMEPPVHEEDESEAFYYDNDYELFIDETPQKHPLEEEYDDLGDMYYPDAPGYMENLNGQYVKMDYEFMYDDSYDIPEEAFIDEEFYPDIEKDYEIPENPADRPYEEYEKYLEMERMSLESILSNDPYYEDMEFVRLEEDIAEGFDDYNEPDEFYFEDVSEGFDDYDEDPDDFYFDESEEKHPLEEEYDDLGDMYYPDAPNYRENLNGQY